MKEYFSIGEISALLGLSSHTLRYYDKIGLLQPAEVNDQTGYRLYAYTQLFTLERVRHLQLLGFTLDQIREIMADVSTGTLARYLERRERDLSAEIEHLSTLRDTVDNYLQYYKAAEDGLLPGVPFKKHCGQRYIFTEVYNRGESLLRSAGYRLMVRKSEKDCEKINFLRQIGFILDYQALLAGKVVPTHYYMFIEDRPREMLPEIQTIPEGDFLCYRNHILSSDANVGPIAALLAGDTGSRLAIANEYEQSLDDSCNAFLMSDFEVQILL